MADSKHSINVLTIRNSSDDEEKNIIRLTSCIVNKKDFNNWNMAPQENDLLQNTQPRIHGSVNLGSKKISAKRKYRIEILSMKKFNEEVVSVSKTVTDFNFTIDNFDTYSVIHLDILNSSLGDGNGKSKSCYKFLKKVDDVLSKISVKVDEKGRMVDVLNKNELREKWLSTKIEFKGNDEFCRLSTEDQCFIIKEGDFEYLEGFNLVNVLRKGYSLHAVLFLGYWQTYEVGKIYSLESVFKNSTLFTDQEVPVEFEVKLKQHKASRGTVELEIQGLEPDDYDPSTFENLYKEKYPVSRTDFEDYSYEYIANYFIENETGLIHKMSTSVFEVLGNVEMFLDFNLKEFTNADSIKSQLAKAKDKLIFWWYHYKMVFLSVLVLCILLSRICVVTIADYAQLQKRDALIISANIETGQYKSLMLKLANDENNYYQFYDNRFYDSNLANLRRGDHISFYTTKNRYYKAKPFIHNEPDLKSFYYYPIFNINSDKSIVSVFFYHFYKNSWLNILLIISLVSTMFYSAPIAITCNWKKRAIMLLLLLLSFWLFY